MVRILYVRVGEPLMRWREVGIELDRPVEQRLSLFVGVELSPREVPERLNKHSPCKRARGLPTQQTTLFRIEMAVWTEDEMLVITSSQS